MSEKPKKSTSKKKASEKKKRKRASLEKIKKNFIEWEKGFKDVHDGYVEETEKILSKIAKVAKKAKKRVSNAIKGDSRKKS